MALELADSIQLVWIAEDKQDRYLDNLCRSWTDALDNFHYVPVDAGLEMDVEDICSEIIKQLKVEPGNMADYDCYIAGEESFTGACKKTMISIGLPSDQLKINRITRD